MEYGFGLSTYAQTVVSTSHCELGLLNAIHFERLIFSRRDPGTLSQMRQRSESRLMGRLAAPSISVSLLSSSALMQHLAEGVKARQQMVELSLRP